MTLSFFIWSKMMKLSKTSWHYRLATVYANNQYYGEDTNFCKYANDVGIGALLVGLIIAAVSAWLGGLLDAAIWAYVVLSQNQYMKISEYGGLTVVLTLIVIMIVIYGYVGMKLSERRRAHRRRATDNIAKPDSFIAAFVKKIRSRACFKVEFID